MKTKVDRSQITKSILPTFTLLLAALAAQAQSWTNRYHGSATGDDLPAALAVDGTGNAIVTGSIGLGGIADYATIKYSNVGIPLWTNRYHALPNEVALATAVAVDTNGNVCVTGWTPPEFFVPGSTGGDYATIKYSSAGAPLWTNRYNGPANDVDTPTAMAVDGSGNVIVSGTSYGFTTGEDYATVKYSSTGVPLWTRRYAGPVTQDQANAMAVDGNGNVLVTGSSEVFDDVVMGTMSELTTFKYSGTGVPLWTNRYRPPAGSAGASAVVVDGSGNAFVAGGSYIPGAISVYDLATIKYSSAGLALWTNRYPGYGVCGLAVDKNGNAIVMGTSGNGTDNDYVTLKYSNDGVPQWTNRFGGNEDGWPAPRLAVDVSGYVIVAGTAGVGRLGSGSNDWVTVKYSASGVAMWTNRYNGPADGDDAVKGVATDSNGNVFVTGQSWNGTSFDYVTIKYAAAVAPPSLNIQRLGSNVVLSWTDAAFGLQSAPSATGTFTNVSGATSPYTNSVSAAQRFFRLIQ